jgi:hypothetical protein
MGIAHPNYLYPSSDNHKGWKSLPHDWEVSMVLPAKMYEVPKRFRLFAQAPRGAGSFYADTEMEPSEDGNIRVRLRVGSTKTEDLDARRDDKHNVNPVSVVQEKMAELVVWRACLKKSLGT